MNERWVTAFEFSGYEVSDFGRVRSCASGEVLAQRTDKDGYVYVRLYTGGKRIEKRVHRMVLEAFVGLPPSPRHQGNHKNFDKTDNSLSNLEWASPKENCRHAGQGQRHIVPARFIQSLPRDQYEAVKGIAENEFAGDWNAAIREVVTNGLLARYRGLRLAADPAGALKPIKQRCTIPLPHEFKEALPDDALADFAAGRIEVDTPTVQSVTCSQCQRTIPEKTYTGRLHQLTCSKWSKGSH